MPNAPKPSIARTPTLSGPVVGTAATAATVETGIFTRLSPNTCSVVDRTGETAYLETERPQNLPIYRK
jgi:hypothetical protein